MTVAVRLGQLAASLALIASPVYAVLVKNDLTDYSHNFDHLGATSDASANTWVDDQSPTIGSTTTGSPGWFWQTGSTPVVYDAGNPSNPGPYSLGTTDSVPPDRAMGAFNDASVANVAWGVVFQNNTGQTINQVDIAYTGEQWRRANPLNSSLVDKLTFSFLTSSSSITDLSPLSGEEPSGWTRRLALDFEAPLENGTPPFFRTAPPSALLSNSIPLSLPNGHFLALRWHDGDLEGDDAALGIDDLTVSFHAASVPEPSAFLFGLLVCGVAGTPWLVGRRRR